MHIADWNGLDKTTAASQSKSMSESTTLSNPKHDNLKKDKMM